MFEKSYVPFLSLTEYLLGIFYKIVRSYLDRLVERIFLALLDTKNPKCFDLYHHLQKRLLFEDRWLQNPTKNFLEIDISCYLLLYDLIIKKRIEPSVRVRTIQSFDFLLSCFCGCFLFQVLICCYFYERHVDQNRNQ